MAKKSKLNRLTTFDYVVIGLLLLFGFIFLYPVYRSVIISFSDTYYITRGFVQWYPMGFNLGAYKLILSNNRVPLAYANTIYYTVIGVLVQIVFATLTAYPLSRPNFWGKSVFMKLIAVTMFFSGGLIPTFLLVSGLHLLDTVWALVLPTAVSTYHMIIVKNFFESISPSLHESATIDGASEFRIFLKIMLPLAKASIATVSMFFFLQHWNAYLAPVIYLNDSKRYPLQVVLRQMLIEGETGNVGEAITENLTPEAMKNATVVVTMIPVLIVYPFAQRYFVKGVMIGAVKG